MRKPAASTTTTSTPCCTKVGLKRGPWTPEEDEVLSNYINKEGEGRWRTLPKRAGLLRCGKSCRLRWMNYLRPSVKRGQIAPDEEDLILRLHRLLGNRWSLIAGRIPGRTDNEIKNYWNTHLSKKLISQGIDPRTHKPLFNATADQLLVTSASPSTTAAAKDDGKASNSLMKRRDLGTSSPDNTSDTGLLERVIYGSDQGLVHSYVGDEEDHFNQAMIDNGTLSGPGDNPFLNLVNNNIGNQDHHDDEINYSCGGEDVFSTFLNSLINEDDEFINTGQMQHPHNQLMQAHHHHLHPPIIRDTVAVPPSAQPADSFGFVNSNAGIDGGWETGAAALISSSFNAVFGEQNCERRFINEHDDQRQC